MYQKSEIFLGNVKGEREIKYVERSDRRERVVMTEKKAVVSFDSSSVQIIIFPRLMRPPAHGPTRNNENTEDRESATPGESKSKFTRGIAAGSLRSARS